LYLDAPPLDYVFAKSLVDFLQLAPVFAAEVLAGNGGL